MFKHLSNLIRTLKDRLLGLGPSDFAVDAGTERARKKTWRSSADDEADVLERLYAALNILSDHAVQSLSDTDLPQYNYLTRRSMCYELRLAEYLAKQDRIDPARVKVNDEAEAVQKYKEAMALWHGRGAEAFDAGDKEQCVYALRRKWEYEKRLAVFHRKAAPIRPERPEEAFKT